MTRVGTRGPLLLACASAIACGDPEPSPATEATGTTAVEDSDPGLVSSGIADATGPPPASSSEDGSEAAESTTAIPPVLDVGQGGGSDPVCSGDLKRVLDEATGVVLQTCPAHQGCLDGRCVPACEAAEAARGSMGCELVVPTSPFFANEQPFAVQSGPCHALLVANPWGRSALLELWHDGVPLDLPAAARIPHGIAAATSYDPLPPEGLPPGEVAVVFLSHRPGVHNGSSLECPVPPAVLDDTAPHGTALGEAFSLHSDTPIVVYDILPYGGAPSYLPSASLVFPTSAWGDGYLVLSPHEPDGIEWLAVVARDDDTTVTLQPTVPLVPGSVPDAPVGQATDFGLDAGQVLQWHASGDPVGSRLVADKPIAVWSGNTFLRVTTADEPASGRDSAHQMLPPVHALGSEHVGAGLPSRLPGGMPESVRYRLVAVVDGTMLHWDPAPPPGAPRLLDAGQAVELETREPFSVASPDPEHPLSLSQYMSGTLSGQPGCTGVVGPCPLGDEDWVVLVPPAQHGSAYTFFVDPTYATTSLVVVRQVGPLGFSPVSLDCLGSIDGWQPVGTAGRFELAHVELFRGGVGSVPACETSQHRATSDGAFGVTVWGTDHAASYGYPAGGHLHPLNQVDVTPAG